MTTRKTALKGFISHLWAVDETWANFAKSVLFNEKSSFPERASDPEIAALTSSGEQPAGTRYTTVHDRTAVIDVYGAIIPRANLFSEWSGGASCQMISKDIEWAVASDDVDRLLLVIHSPGGEVTGVSELAEQIYRARESKQVTAYIAGMGCSAAYWIASACSRVYANPTAIVGSIGVMSVYVDDSKQLEKIGIEEIEFVSSQSPYKNAGPKTAEGRKRIQQRVDALAQVFVETIARNRGVDAAEVLKNYGQGDVFVGADAKRAGMVDEIGGFAEAFLLAVSEPDASGAPEKIKERKNKMAEKQETATVAVDAAEFEALQKQLADLQKANTDTAAALEALQAEKARLEEEKLDAELRELSQNWAGNQENNFLVLKALAAGGRDSAEFKAFVENQKAVAAQIDASTLFEEQGVNRGGEERDAYTQLEEKARQIAAAKNVSFYEAFGEAMQANPELYEQYKAEQAKGE